MKRRKELVKVEEVKVRSKIIAEAKLALALIALAELCVCAAAQEDTADYWYKKNGELFVNGSSEESILALDKALQIDPVNATLWQSKGLQLALIGKKDEALIAHQKALEIINRSIEKNPEDAEAWLHKAETLRSMSWLEEAVKAYDKAIELYPERREDAWVAWENKAQILMQLGKHDESIEEGFDLAPIRRALNSCVNIFNLYGRF